MRRDAPNGREGGMRGKSVIAVFAAAVSLALAPALGHAEDYPSRPITMIVPLAPGGSTDTLGRIMAQGMRPTLNQPVLVENTAGAAGRSASRAPCAPCQTATPS